ncbi:class I SAM-dependent methyltransferase [Rubrivivax gelatinosus]|uniref:Methyltransferase family protein n=1 Tax=Rubrivivax gelatinosus TaxID=28068 RepID=A0A4R2M7F9_RUBGE|nr:class I SAM-dependent methyltransferase [Rubrivivax gelatinosus]MBK1689227.1 methyltransferase type 11 [Rubrivivax gelatinosus]TCP02051.1 methyltransferase family protein [Rubrivivax gelatinosus]
MHDAHELNRRSYDAIAADWEDARTSLSDAEARLLDGLLDGLPTGARVLDLGCGTGRPMAEAVAARGLQVTGIDQSAAMLARSRARLPGHDWRLARLEDFEPDGPYAAALAWDSLFHVPREAHAGILRRVRAALAPGAGFMLTVGGSAHPAFTDTMFGHEFFYDSHPPETACALLEAEGFAVVLHEFLNRPTEGRDKGRVAIVARVA